jgi:HPt (histidine-containing phosphotransfer) domain-containing protein
LHAAAAAGDAERFQRAAHSLKGSIASFGKTEASQLALELEAIARRGDTKEAWSTLQRSEVTFARFLKELAEFLRDGSDC